LTLRAKDERLKKDFALQIAAWRMDAVNGMDLDAELLKACLKLSSKLKSNQSRSPSAG
jgi:translation elongation factor EF-Ts